MISDYLNQTATWEVFAGTSDLYGVPTYAPSKSIKCRIRSTPSQVITDHGAVIDAKYIIHTTADVSVADKVNGLEVKSVEDYVNYAGVTIGKLVFT